MARIREQADRAETPEPEITPAAREDVLGTEPTPGSDATNVDTFGRPELNEDAERARAQRELDAGGESDDAESEDLDPNDKRDGEPFVSEGVRQDLLTFGEAVDPGTGGTFRLDEDSGSATFTPKARLRRPEPIEQLESRPVTIKTETI